MRRCNQSGTAIGAPRFRFAFTGRVREHCEACSEAGNDGQDDVAVHRHHHQHQRNVQDRIEDAVEGRDHSFPDY
jgi:hypothetical protein